MQDIIIIEPGASFEIKTDQSVSTFLVYTNNQWFTCSNMAKVNTFVAKQEKTCVVYLFKFNEKKKHCAVGGYTFPDNPEDKYYVLIDGKSEIFSKPENKNPQYNYHHNLFRYASSFSELLSMVKFVSKYNNVAIVCGNKVEKFGDWRCSSSGKVSMSGEFKEEQKKKFTTDKAINRGTGTRAKAENANRGYSHSSNTGQAKKASSTYIAGLRIEPIDPAYVLFMFDTNFQNYMDRYVVMEIIDERWEGIEVGDVILDICNNILDSHTLTQCRLAFAQADNPNILVKRYDNLSSNAKKLHRVYLPSLHK